MTDLSTNVSLSRDSIRISIINNIKEYLELENIDLTKSSFLTFLVDTISTLTSNLLFYEVSVFREFFMTTAQTKDAIYNLSAFLGYDVNYAKYANCNVLIKIPNTFTDSDVQFTIPNEHRFYANDIEFMTYYVTYISVDNGVMSVYIVRDNERFNLDVSFNNETNEFIFLLPVRQIRKESFSLSIDQDIGAYQFINKKISTTGDVSEQLTEDIIVEVTEPGDLEATKYNSYKSLYLIPPGIQGFVTRRSDDGIVIYFGNSLVGYRPKANSTVNVIIYTTRGTFGNIISGSIKNGDKIYYVDSYEQNGQIKNISRVVNYSVVNPSSAYGGTNSESLEEIRRNSIVSLTALGRLVSGPDFSNTKTIIPNLPIRGNILPVLKRSDAQLNEIQLYFPLIFDYNQDGVDDILATRNVWYVPTLTEINEQNINSGKVFDFEDNEYVSIFDMKMNFIQKSCVYSYVIRKIDFPLVFVSRYISEYDFTATTVRVERLEEPNRKKVRISIPYESTEENISSCECSLNIRENSTNINMINDSTSSEFYTEIFYSSVSEGPLNITYTISDPIVGNIGKYSSNFIIRQSLDFCMMSNMTYTKVGNNYNNLTIYDIPTIERSQYDEIMADSDLANLFELNIIQVILTNADLKNYRMLTDFVNLKFTNTHGKISNIYHNNLQHSDVSSKSLTAYPGDSTSGERYIISGEEGGIWTGKKGYIAEMSESGWVYTVPNMDDVVYITDEEKKYIYGQNSWVYPEYTMPLEIHLEVKKLSTYSGTSSGLATNIREALFENLQDSFGNNAEFYISRMIDVVHNVGGVSHCRVIKPETNIFFNYELKDLPHEELLIYSPEYIYIKEENITIDVI